MLQSPPEHKLQRYFQQSILEGTPPLSQQTGPWLAQRDHARKEVLPPKTTPQTTPQRGHTPTGHCPKGHTSKEATPPLIAKVFQSTSLMTSQDATPTTNLKLSHAGVKTVKINNFRKRLVTGYPVCLEHHLISILSLFSCMYTPDVSWLLNCSFFSGLLTENLWTGHRDEQEAWKVVFSAVG